jgi:hypothetical protein
MAVERAKVSMGLSVTESLSVDAAGYLSPNDDAVTYNGGNVDITLDADSTPAIDSHAVGKQALTAGAATIDLTALTGPNGVAVSLSGKKPRAILLENTGANAMTVAKGASNGYTGLGASFSLTLPAGAKVELYVGANGTAVSGTDKTLDLTGTLVQELKYQVVCGT